MSNEQITSYLSKFVNDDQIWKCFHQLNDEVDALPGFVSVHIPYTSFTDYLTAVPKGIVAISDCDGEFDGHLFTIVPTIEDYVNLVLYCSNEYLTFQEGFESFEAAYEAAKNF